MKPELWTKEVESRFFIQTLNSFASPEQLFYIGEDSRYYAYWPKSYKGKKTTLQSRNALIGQFSEKFCVDLLQNFARTLGLYAVQGVICPPIGLTPQSPADVVLSRTKRREQSPEEIQVIFEVKMSVVWNWEWKEKGKTLIYLGDYRTHQGNPGLLRSDSMLKAIGKSINIRVSNYVASKIPIVILGNTPIMTSYYSKVDHLYHAGIIQGFWSLNPQPVDTGNDPQNIKSTPAGGFLRIDSYEEFVEKLRELFSEQREFFSGMKTKVELGKLIEIANREATYEKKGEKFLTLLKEIE